MNVCVPISSLPITLICGSCHSLPPTTPRYRRRKLIVNCILDLFDVDNKHNKDVGDKFLLLVWWNTGEERKKSIKTVIVNFVFRRCGGKVFCGCIEPQACVKKFKKFNLQEIFVVDAGKELSLKNSFQTFSVAFFIFF